jgi:hypothetical protein
MEFYDYGIRYAWECRKSLRNIHADGEERGKAK